jgi:hypothetical protein
MVIGTGGRESEAPPVSRGGSAMLIVRMLLRRSGYFA